MQRPYRSPRLFHWRSATLGSGDGPSALEPANGIRERREKRPPANVISVHRVALVAFRLAGRRKVAQRHPSQLKGEDGSRPGR